MLHMVLRVALAGFCLAVTGSVSPAIAQLESDAPRDACLDTGYRIGTKEFVECMSSMTRPKAIEIICDHADFVTIAAHSKCVGNLVLQWAIDRYCHEAVGASGFYECQTNIYRKMLQSACTGVTNIDGIGCTMLPSGSR
jgi:hypothetical protein